MLNPQFPFDPSSRFTFLELKAEGGAGVRFFDIPATPTGVNRLFFLASTSHSDGAADHVLGMSLLNPTADISFGIPVDDGGIAQHHGASANATVPIIVPPGWSIRCSSNDNIAAGAVLDFFGLYMDFLVGVV